MNRTRNVVAWLVLGVGIVVAALYLNSAAYSAWVAGGPPNAYPESWAQRALVHLCAAGAFVCGAVAVFRGVRSFPRIGALTISLGLVALLLLGVGEVREFFLVDSCLDRGGSWNHEEFKCAA
jgi:hypothetical protein